MEKGLLMGARVRLGGRDNFWCSVALMITMVDSS
jgi:hypothetical protein